MRFVIHFFISLVMSLSMLQAVYAQEATQNVGELLSKKMSQVRKNEPVTISDDSILAADPKGVLGKLILFEQDPSPSVRHSAYTIAWQIARRNEDVRIRQEVVRRLLIASNDPEPLVWQQASMRLLSFNAEDFSGAAKSLVRERISEYTPKREMVLVAGVANIQGEMNRLRKMLIDESGYEKGPHSGRWYGTVGWAARLALSRMGSEEDIAHAISMVVAEPDPVIRVTRLLNDLAYIRQPQVIEILKRYLQIDERLPRIKETVPGTRYCQYALNLLAQILEGFPIRSVGPGGYSQSEIDNAREWMNTQLNRKIIR